MLTENEKKWLGNREFANAVDYGAYSCPSCWWLNKELEECILRRCLRFDPDWQDVAEFEARVAVYLAKSPCLTCPDNPQGGCSTRKLNSYGRAHVEACRLKHARLAVEEEMDV